MELKKRLEKAENQYRELESSLTKQASDWIAQKKQVAQMERDIRWSQVRKHYFQHVVTFLLYRSSQYQYLVLQKEPGQTTQKAKLPIECYIHKIYP